MITIYDENGNGLEKSKFHDRFGKLYTINDPAHPRNAYDLTEFRIVSQGRVMGGLHPTSPASLSVAVRDLDGAPFIGIPVVWWYSTAPPLPGSGHLEQGIIGHTNESGIASFALSHDAYYDPVKGEVGPHQVWISGPGQSVRVVGLGMLIGTNHDHVDLEFRPSTTSPGPVPDEQAQKIRALRLEARVEYNKAIMRLGHMEILAERIVSDARTAKAEIRRGNLLTDMADGM